MKPIEMLTALCFVFSCLISTTYSQSQNISAADVTYQDLKDLGASCEPKDTCLNDSIQLNDSSDRNCDCDALCIDYDTCCVDSPYRKHNANLKSGVERQTCVNVEGHTGSFFMVSECLPRWTGNQETLNKCHERDTRDPHTLLPVVDLEKNVTYKNVFCAICNDIKLRRLAVWEIKANIIPQPNYSEEVIVKNLIYDEDRKSWGHWDNGSMSFSPVQIIVTIPEEGLLRSCTASLIRDCDRTWTDRVISQKCQSYMAPIYATKRGNSFPERYRNVHCAICNFAQWTNQSDICTRADDAAKDSGDQYTFRIDDKKDKKIKPVPLSFTLLFDYNTIDGPNVGKISRCRNGETYDSFYRKCRKLFKLSEVVKTQI